ncbi:MAG: carboxypeptidase regulatory-like domain-containing protein [Armatimonadota bacterium]|nr:carboxypeptidase regulatory-like domain-containing protein [Armatimonadota bacterium]
MRLEVFAIFLGAALIFARAPFGDPAYGSAATWRQSPGILTGRVIDAVTRAGLPAIVFTKGNMTWVGQADTSGYYSTQLPPGTYSVNASRSGYKEQKKQTLVKGGVTTQLDFALQPLNTTVGTSPTPTPTPTPTPAPTPAPSSTPTPTSDEIAQLIYEWFGPPFRSGLEYGWGAPWGRHEARLATNPSWDWTEGARPAQWATPPPGYTAMSGWGQVVEAAGGIGPTRNFRVHVRWNRLYAFVNGVWHLVESTDQYGIQGGWFRNTDFSSASGYVSWRKEAEGFSVSWQSAPAGTLLHWWINSWPHPLIPTGATAFYAVAQVRLIPDTDPNVDLSAVQVYGGVGNDWWSSPTGQGGPGTGIPRHKRLTAQWKTFASATIPTTAPPKNDPNYDYNTAVRSFSQLPPLFYY